MFRGMDGKLGSDLMAKEESLLLRPTDDADETLTWSEHGLIYPRSVSITRGALIVRYCPRHSGT